MLRDPALVVPVLYVPAPVLPVPGAYTQLLLPLPVWLALPVIDQPPLLDQPVVSLSIVAVYGTLTGPMAWVLEAVTLRVRAALHSPSAPPLRPRTCQV